MAPTPASSWPRWVRWTLAAEFLLPSLALLAAAREAQALLVPIAGPWAARLYGHSCGMADQAPVWTGVLAGFGVVSLALALRHRRPAAAIPAALIWWPAWLFVAFVSAVNAHM